MALPFRDLPSVHEILSKLSAATRQFPHELLVSEVRGALAEARNEIRSGATLQSPIETRVERALSRLASPSLRHVVNATGVVLHTNLGRAPLLRQEALSGYSNLEYDLATGARGRRDTHTSELFERLLGAPAIAVNNGAAALYLALHELAAGSEVIVSRGELIEIGDGFRIPDIMHRSGAILREVGTTNRTRISDYRDAITERTQIILRVHPSNFKITGFTAQPELRELVGLGIPVLEDLGSGCVTDLRAFGIQEPLVQESLEAGVSLVSFSGDKLLGGPQAGILAGNADLIARLRRNPMFRALRLDKLICQALESTLRALLFEEWDRLPALRMLRLSADEIRIRAESLAAQIPDAEVIPGYSVTGGGATPEQQLPTFLVALAGNATQLEKRLRGGEPPIISRIENGRVLLDLRTVFPEEEEILLNRLRPVPDTSPQRY